MRDENPVATTRKLFEDSRMSVEEDLAKMLTEAARLRAMRRKWKETGRTPRFEGLRYFGGKRRLVPLIRQARSRIDLLSHAEGELAAGALASVATILEQLAPAPLSGGQRFYWWFTAFPQIKAGYAYQERLRSHMLKLRGDLLQRAQAA